MAPGAFAISERVPVILNSVFITLTFAAGLPLLMPIACASMLLTYWVDKYALLRLYARPPSMGDDIAQVCYPSSPAGLYRFSAGSPRHSCCDLT
jgi:hypothetical protein